jgi:hypothetical protein
VLYEPNKDPLYILAGRSFTLADLKKSVIMAAGGKLTEVYLSIWSMDLWEIIESIEIVTEVNRREDSSSRLWDALANNE